MEIDKKDRDSSSMHEVDEGVEHLISDELQPPKNRLHTILTIIALFIIVLMSTIIATKMILDDSQKSDTLLQDPDTIQDPELIKDEVKKKESQALKPETKSIYDIASYDDGGIDGIDTKEATSIMDVEESNSIPKPTPKDKPTQSQPKEPSPQPKAQPKPPSHAVPTTSNGDYYIQVGSFVEAPGKRFLSIIKSNGFSYIIRQQGGNKKLLIGAYGSRAQASKALIDVKDKINKNAFITR